MGHLLGAKKLISGFAPTDLRTIVVGRALLPHQHAIDATRCEVEAED